MINRVLEFRQIVLCFYKQREKVFLFCFRLLAGVFIFSLVNSIGLYSDTFTPLFTAPFNLPYFLLSVLFFAILPPTLAGGLVAFEIVIQISGSVEVALFAAIAFILILVFYARLQPKSNFLIIAMVIGFYLKIPYAVVIFAGLYMGISSMVPVVIGALIYQFIPVFGNLTQGLANSGQLDIFSTSENILDVYRYIFDSFSSVNNFSWIFVGFSFSMTLVAVHLLSKSSINFSKEIAIVAGGTLCLVFGIIGIIIESYNEDIPSLILFSLLSVVLILLIRFFDCVLDYRRVEHVQFEDNDNFYYVKVIPKKMVPIKGTKNKEDRDERT